MSFEPLLPLTGYAGWLFLDRTAEAQKEQHASAPVLQSDAEYFAEHISDVRTAEDLVGDYRLLKVSLGAFGLDDDIGNQFFVRKVLEDGTSSSDALANRLSDKRYLEFSLAFGFGQGIPARTTLSGFSDEIVPAYLERQFEVSVGDQNEDFRLALDAKRELTEIAQGSLSENGMWYSVMASTSLRTVFETAFGLPVSFASLDLDVQLNAFRDKASLVLGSGEIAQFSEPDCVDDLIRTFMLRSEMDNTPAGLSSSSIALSLLSGISS